MLSPEEKALELFPVKMVKLTPTFDHDIHAHYRLTFVKGVKYANELFKTEYPFEYFDKHVIHSMVIATKERMEELGIPRTPPALSHWVKFDFMDLETRPSESGKYLVCRKDGKIHWETWNGSGWAYNHKVITHWAAIVPPTKDQ